MSSRRPPLAALRDVVAARLDSPKKVRLAALGGAVTFVVIAFGACSACGKGAAPRGATSASASASASGSAEVVPLPVDGGPRAVSALWARAKDGDDEDLGNLANHEGAFGLVEGASDAELRPTALRAMAFARGYAQVAFLAKTAEGGSDADARIALESLGDVAVRPRTAEDPEDADELEEGCRTLLSLAQTAAKPRERRVQAIRVLRMLPCPKAELPSDLDAK